MHASGQAACHQNPNMAAIRDHAMSVCSLTTPAPMAEDAPASKHGCCGQPVACWALIPESALFSGGGSNAKGSGGGLAILTDTTGESDIAWLALDPSLAGGAVTG